MKNLFYLIIILLTSCVSTKDVMQGEETPARLISIDTTMYHGDPLWKTLHFKFILKDSLYYDIQFVPMYDTRTVGIVQKLPRPLSGLHHITKE